MPSKRVFQIWALLIVRLAAKAYQNLSKNDNNIRYKEFPEGKYRKYNFSLT